MKQEPQQKNTHDRRSFITRSTGVAATTFVLSNLPAVHAETGGDADIRIGLIGCGGRGTGAVMDALGAAAKVIWDEATNYPTLEAAESAKAVNKGVRVVALADLFDERIDRCQHQMKRLGFDIPPEQCFTGFDGYKDLLKVSEVNYVIIASPPHFHPKQLEAAVAADKNVFMEKPAGVDVPGVKATLRAGEMAKQQGLCIVGGTQRRYSKSYQETIGRIHAGELGEIVSGKCYWNGNQIWVVPRMEGWSDVEWQMRNWNHFRWLSGDHYVEQHVHNLDIMNWVMGTHPVRAVSGLGGRQVRTAEQYGNIYDHFSVEYEYPGGITMFSQARQINGCKNIVAESVSGTLGQSDCKETITLKSGKTWEYSEKELSPYKQEHLDMINAIRDGKPINAARAIAESTMTGILGREAVYTGQEISWDDAMANQTRLGPTEYKFGDYEMEPIPMPGTYKFM